MKFSSPKDLIPIENRSGIYFIPCSSCNIGYSGQTRRRLKAKLDKHRRKVINEEINTSSIASHCCSFNHYLDFTKACIVFSPFSTSHLNFYEAFYILKNSNNLVNDLFSTPSTSDAWKLLVQIYLSIKFLLYLTLIKYCNRNFLKYF